MLIKQKSEAFQFKKEELAKLNPDILLLQLSPTDLVGLPGGNMTTEVLDVQ